MKTLIAVLLLSLSSLTIAQAQPAWGSANNNSNERQYKTQEENRPQQAWGSASSQRSQEEHEANERREQEERNKGQYNQQQQNQQQPQTIYLR